jgi:hypothetical protein
MCDQVEVTVDEPAIDHTISADVQDCEENSNTDVQNIIEAKCEAVNFLRHCVETGTFCTFCLCHGHYWEFCPLSLERIDVRSALLFRLIGQTGERVLYKALFNGAYLDANGKSLPVTISLEDLAWFNPSLVHLPELDDDHSMCFGYLGYILRIPHGFVRQDNPREGFADRLLRVVRSVHGLLKRAQIISTPVIAY